MKNTLASILALLIMFVALPALATNYYVDPSSSGSNAGTYNDPWKSMADVPQWIGCFQPGDTVFFKRGQQFTGTLYINSSGSASAPIVFMPYGSGDAPVFQYNLSNPPAAMPANRMLISLNQANYIVIDGFELTDATMPEYDHTITANVGYGVYIYAGSPGNGSHNTIKNLAISRVGSGISIDGGSDNTITQCTIKNLRMIVNTSWIMDDDYGATAVVLSGSDNTISHNRIQDCYATSADYQYDGGGIEMYGSISNNKILYNTAINNQGWMEFGSGVGGSALNNLVGYNLLINNGTLCWINAGNGFNVSVGNLQFINNTVVETQTSRTPSVTNLLGISALPSISNVVTMKNNIFWITTGMNITDPILQWFNGAQMIHQNNLYHLTGGSQGFIADVTEKTLNNYDSVFMDITSSSDPASWNFKLRQYCKAVDMGQTTSLSKDYYDQQVPFGGAPDAGIAENISAVILPIQFNSFKGWNTANGNNVEWMTSNDQVNHFEVEKSTDGNNFKTISTVAYSTTSTTYDFVDKDVITGTHYYRIKAIEPSNEVTYSQIVSIKTGVSDNGTGLKVWPNPVQADLYLKIPGGDFRNKEIEVVSMGGVQLKRIKMNEAVSQTKLNVSELPRGAYAVKIVDHTNGQSFNSIFIK